MVRYNHLPESLFAHRLISARSIDLRAILQPVENAGYDCGPRANERCHEGTRVGIINTINDWGPSRKPIRWLNGSAGSGKSAIARSVAHAWNNYGQLAGSFCFFRNSGDQSKASRLLPTVAFQLSISIPETKQAIENAIRSDPSLLHRSIDQQFRKLIVEPIMALCRHPDAPVLIVVDGVDECDDSHLIAQLIEAITDVDFSQFPVRFLFTSRMEERIRIIFHARTTSAITHELSLSSINADQDIRLFLRLQFHSIHHDKRRLMKNIPLPWPSSPELSQIVRIVNGSFIFASTLLKYVRDGLPPPLRLRPIVEAHTGVDDMYKEILTQFWNDNCFQAVFSTIMLLKSPLSVTGLESLLNLGDNRVLFELLKIQSVVLIPDDDEKPVDIVHTSLRDFSTSLQRSEIFCVESSQNHLHITMCCLQVMVTEPEQVFFEGEAAKYASRYWIDHLHIAFKDRDSLYVWYDALVEELELFTRQCLKAWFNTIAITEGPYAITEISQLLEGIPRASRVSLPPMVAYLH